MPAFEERDCMLVRALFLRLLAVVYLVAFGSLWVQIHGLVGSRGILPVGKFLERAGSLLGEGAWLRAPTFCWLSSSDAALDIQCGLGVALALILLAGAAPATASAGLWALYLSLFTAGQRFLAFQWDLLLLETGFLAILWSPAVLRPQRVWTSPSRAVLWLLRWLQFRLMFSSGYVKLASGDPAWRELRALDFHYETQPLPSWTSWYVHNLPEWFHSGEVLATFAIELIVPFAIFAGRRARLAAAAAFALLQVVIAATGNLRILQPARPPPLRAVAGRRCFAAHAGGAGPAPGRIPAGGAAPQAPLPCKVPGNPADPSPAGSELHAAGSHGRFSGCPSLFSWRGPGGRWGLSA